MPHLEPDELTRHALHGDAHLSDRQRAHLAGCVGCAAELEAIADVVRRARAAGPPAGELEAPPERVWSRIEAELRAGGRDGGGPTAPGRLPRPARRAPQRQPEARHRPWLGGVAAGLAVLAVLGAALSWPVWRQRADVVATVALDPLAGGEAVEARLLASGGGLMLDVDPLPEADGGTYLELWLLAEDLSGMVSLGPVHGATPAPVPPGLDLSDYRLVDVSVEPLDGDPEHSGDSVVRGRLPAGAPETS